MMDFTGTSFDRLCATDIDNLEMLAERIEQQTTAFPEGFTYDRNGVRLGIAAIEDETCELWHEWQDNKRNIGNARSSIVYELLDIAAVCMLILRNAVKED